MNNWNDGSEKYNVEYRLKQTLKELAQALHEIQNLKTENAILRAAVAEAVNRRLEEARASAGSPRPDTTASGS